METNITNELDMMNSWLSHNKLSLNADKTKCMVFHTCQKKIEPIEISINDIKIENVKRFKFLGIMFDEN